MSHTSLKESKYAWLICFVLVIFTVFCISSVAFFPFHWTAKLPDKCVLLAIISSLIPRVCSRRHCVAIGGVRVRILFYSTAELATGNRHETDKTEALRMLLTKRKYSNLPIKVGQVQHSISTALPVCVPLNFLVTVKAAPHEYIIRSGLIQG